MTQQSSSFVNRTRSFIIIFIFLSVCTLQAKDFVIINKIMYDTPLNEQIATSQPYSNGEFVELYNAGVDAVNLSGWTMRGGGTTEIYSFPTNTIMNPKSFLIVAYQYNNTSFTLAQLYTGLVANANNQIVYQRKIILSNSGEKLYIRDNNGTTKDSIYYDGTSSKTKPNRLSADNADDISGNSCVCLQRKTAVFDNDGSAITNNLDWCTAIVNPFQLYSSFIPPALPGIGVHYTYDSDGYLYKRKIFEVGAPQGVKHQTTDNIKPIEDQLEEQKIIIYPNPTNGIFSIEISQLNDLDNNYYQLYSTTGTILRQSNIQNEIIDFNITSYPSGTYLLNIYLGKNVSLWKVIKK